MGGRHNCLGLPWFEPLEELGLKFLLVLPLGGQVAFHAPDKGPGALGEAFQVRLALLGRRLGVVVKARSHADKVAGVIAVVQ